MRDEKQTLLSRTILNRLAHLLHITAVIGAVYDTVSGNIDSSGDPCDLQSAVADHGKLQTERRRQWNWRKVNKTEKRE